MTGDMEHIIPRNKDGPKTKNNTQRSTWFIKVSSIVEQVSQFL
jgi:hypothetical protein